MVINKRSNFFGTPRFSGQTTLNSKHQHQHQHQQNADLYLCSAGSASNIGTSDCNETSSWGSMGCWRAEHHQVGDGRIQRQGRHRISPSWCNGHIGRHCSNRNSDRQHGYSDLDATIYDERGGCFCHYRQLRPIILSKLGLGHSEFQHFRSLCYCALIRGEYLSNHSKLNIPVSN